MLQTVSFGSGGKLITSIATEKIKLTPKNYVHLDLLAAKSAVDLCTEFVAKKDERFEFIKSKAKFEHDAKVKFNDEMAYIQEMKGLILKHITRLQARPVNKLRIFNNYKR